MPPRVPVAPADLANLTQTADFRQRFTTSELGAIDRLVTRPDMHAVWNSLSESEDTYLPHAFFDRCICCPREWVRLSSFPDKKLAQHLATIADKADALAQLVEISEAEICSIRDWPLSVEMLLGELALRDQARHPPKTSRASGAVEIDTSGNFSAEGLDATADPDEREAEGPAPTPIDALLREFARVLRGPPALLTDVLRPTKPNDPNAYRTFLVRALTHFFLSHERRPKADLVARTVSAMLDLDSPMDANHVSKLTTDLQALAIDPDDNHMSPD